MDNSKAKILSAAVSLARRRGLRKLTRLDVANAAEIATGTVNYHFDTMDKLRDSVVRVAIAKEVLPVLAEAIVCKNRLVRNLSPTLRMMALESLTRP